MHLRLGFAIVFVAQVLLTTSSFADWPQFRGPGGNASSDEAVPTTWSDTENIAWKQKLPGRGASSPIVFGDRIFLTAYTGFGISDSESAKKSDLRLHVICLDRETGKQIWDKSVPANEKTQDFTKRIRDHGYTSSTPVTDGEAVYAYFGVSGVVAYSWDGELLWQRQVGTKTAGFGSASSPIVHKDLVIVNASIESDTVFAFRKESGEVAWTISPVVKSWSTACVASTKDGSMELVVNQKETIYGYDPVSGKQLWECEGIQDYVVPVPVSDSGIVYCLGGRSNRAIAVRLGGRGDVSETHKLWESNIGANVTSPTYYDGHLYWASDKGLANCMDASTGKSIYRERMPTRSRVYASIVRAGPYLYLSTRDSGVQILAATPTYKEIGRNTLDLGDDLLSASPAIDGNRLLLRTDSYLYCIAKNKSK